MTCLIPNNDGRRHPAQLFDPRTRRWTRFSGCDLECQKYRSAIKEEKKRKLDHIDADELDIWKVSKPAQPSAPSVTFRTYFQLPTPFRGGAGRCCLSIVEKGDESVCTNLPNPLLKGASVATVTFGIAVGFMSRARLLNQLQ